MLIGLAVAAIVLRLAWWLWWWLPKQQVDRLRLTDAQARADVEDNFRKTAGQLLGGAAVLIGAGIAYVQFTQQQETAREQSVEQQRAARDLLISNQVSKGFEQLGSDKVPVRLGGIYALEGVMNTSEQYHHPVLEALCAFVRDGTKTSNYALATDIQAALSVIARRKVGAGFVDLAGAHIPKAVLSLTDLCGANLSSAQLSGANLSGTSLISADLSRADLSRADLSRADLTFARLDGANLAAANLSRADLWAADMIDVNLTDTDLSDVTGLTQGQLDGACGNEKTKLDPPLTIKPCPVNQPAAGSAK